MKNQTVSGRFAVDRRTGIQLNTGWERMTMRSAILCMLLAFLTSFLSAQTTSANCCTLTIVVEGMSSSEGNLGVLIFNNGNGWPDDRQAAYKDIAVPAEKGTQTLKVSNLPPGNYAVALIHDVNKDHKLDKNWIGKPKEQWGMSNNPHATIKAPPISKAMFELKTDKEIHVELQ
jgi:uncharacterized protein (DUF2141 family)